jgi:hypothetical protein
MRYFNAVPSKFACAISKFQNNISVLCARTAHEAEGVANFFLARRIILTMSDYSLVIARECGGNRDAQSRIVKMLKCQNCRNAKIMKTKTNLPRKK